MNQISQQTFQPHSQSQSRMAPGGRARIAIVSSSWHRDIVANGTRAIRSQLEQSTELPSEVDHFEVPGAFEIPLHAQRLARSGRYAAIVTCGLVVNGGVYRHEFVASAVIDALMRVQLDTDVPVFSAVLTPRDFHEHDEHRGFFAQHFIKKGEEAARTCVATLLSLRNLLAEA